jgi:murein DD-endopeptidase MepM/ murein hydrolase activator NlpD
MKLKGFEKTELIFLAVAIAALVLFIVRYSNKTSIQSQQIKKQSLMQTITPPITKPDILPPIDNFESRITKKPFGIKVSPGNSPVSPERFSGYHTGTDFETTADEQNTDVSIFAICDGNLILKKQASGYGGVVVQTCKIHNEDMTIIYGHLKLSSINTQTNQFLKAGDKIGILGKGYSSETDGERKHLHLAIHKGKGINLLGYVQNQNDLNNWIDPISVLKP